MWPFQRTPSIDPAQGDPRARTLITALTGQDRDTIRQIFTETTDHDERAFLMATADDVPGVQDWITGWITDEPESTLPLLIRGCHAVAWAWDARGGRLARYTSSDKFAEFHRRLKIAENCLDEVTDRDPDEVLAWAWLTTSARGRQVPTDTATERFRQVTKRAPHHLLAHEQRLQHLCRKWAGSHAEMFAFAREATAGAPPGHLLPNVLAIAHLEYWLSLPGGEDAAYMTTPLVRADLRTAAEQSILHPAFTRTPGWASRANTFAMALHMAGEYQYAAHVFDLIGDHVTEWPWFYRTLFGSPARTFAKARRDVHRSRR
ncbi:DUF4034 domain-containing protein [Actinoplanes sp. G11-F43]|uniref:DUF4034 domain-containing protein n=1 Tax=Actinoplanes sp. G11-F43 TaxID=3424130 RepID=UPI003D33BBA8